MVGVAMGWQMYVLTGSALDLGLVGLAQFLPATVLFLVAGQLADRYDRRRIAQVSQLVEGCAAAALAYGAFTGTTSKELILVAAFFLGAGRAGESPTMQTLLPAVVPTRLFPRAVAASSAAQQVATISGPALGGLIYALNPTAVYAICFAMFALAATQLAFLQIRAGGDADAGHARRLLRRHLLYPAEPHPARRHGARPVRGAARRRHRAAADLRQGRVRGRTRPASACCAPRPRSARC